MLLFDEREVGSFMMLMKKMQVAPKSVSGLGMLLTSLKERRYGDESVVLVQVLAHSFSLVSCSRSMLCQLFVASVYPAIEESRYVANPF